MRVSGPGPDPVVARWLSLGDGTAMVELAQSSGLPLLREPDPLRAHTRGLGEVVAAALGTGPTRLVVGLGGSASTDGGTGCLSALGARFEDRRGTPLPPGGGGLQDLHRVDLGGLPPVPAEGVLCLTDVTAPLLGEAGAARVFAPQKGATRPDVDVLERGLARLAELLGGFPDAPGAGAAGGTAYGLCAAWGATIAPGAAAVADAVGLAEAVRTADVVVTGEGCFDRTSLSGKVVGNLVDLVAAGKALAVVAGRVEVPAPDGVSRLLSLTDLAGSREAALADPVRWLRVAGGLLSRS